MTDPERARRKSKEGPKVSKTKPRQRVRDGVRPAEAEGERGCIKLAIYKLRIAQPQCSLPPILI